MDNAIDVKLLLEKDKEAIRVGVNQKIIRNITNNLTPEILLEGLVLSEILAKPLSKRRRRR